jgi:hypothetical protein
MSCVAGQVGFQCFAPPVTALIKTSLVNQSLFGRKKRAHLRLDVVSRDSQGQSTPHHSEIEWWGVRTINGACLWGETDMRRRVGVLFATTVLNFLVLAARRARAASEENDKKTAINVVLAHERACQTCDFDKLDSLHKPDSRGIEEFYPHPFEPDEHRGHQAYQDAGRRMTTHSLRQAIKTCGCVSFDNGPSPGSGVNR